MGLQRHPSFSPQAMNVLSKRVNYLITFFKLLWLCWKAEMEAEKSGRCLSPPCLREYGGNSKEGNREGAAPHSPHLKIISQAHAPAHMKHSDPNSEQTSHSNCPINNLLQSPLGLSERENMYVENQKLLYHQQLKRKSLNSTRYSQSQGFPTRICA